MGSNAQPEEVRGYDDVMICYRMFGGNLCQSYFGEANGGWFAYREQLRAEIEAKTTYLDWMDSKDNDGVGYYATTSPSC